MSCSSGYSLGGGGGGGGGGCGSPSGAINTVPTVAGFPTTVLPAGSAVDSTAALLLRGDGHGPVFAVQQILQAAPGVPWERYYKFEINPVQKAFLYAGFMVKRSADGRFVIWTIIHTGSVFEIQYSEYNNLTSRAFFTTLGVLESTNAYFKIEDDGADFILSVSPAGQAGTYTPLYSISRTNWLADYDLIGFGIDGFNAGLPNVDCIAAIQHYAASPPTFTAGCAGGGGGGGGGITQLTGDVVAGPGSGSQASTLTAQGINRANNLGLVTIAVAPTANQLRDVPAFRCDVPLAGSSFALVAPTGLQDGRQVTFINASGGTVQIDDIGATSSRVMSISGGSTWVYSAVDANWFCTSNV